MKSTSHCKAATIICIMAALILSSCIYEAPGDRFYRTLWESGPDTPFGTVTLEFLCGGQVAVSAPGCIGSFGRYIPSGTSATLDGLSLTVDGIEAAITHAVRNGDALTLTWYNVTDDGTASSGGLSTVIPAPPSQATGPSSCTGFRNTGRTRRHATDISCHAGLDERSARTMMSNLGWADFVNSAQPAITVNPAM